MKNCCLSYEHPFLSKQLDKTGMTIWPIILFFKCPFIQLLQTESADKMFRVELFIHGRYTSPRDWFLAACTQGTTFQVIMCLTVRKTFVVKETTATKWLMTFLKKMIKIGFISIFCLKDIATYHYKAVQMYDTSTAAINSNVQPIFHRTIQFSILAATKSGW